MTSETFLKGLDLSDALIAESDPEDFHKKVRLFRKRILSIGALAAAVVLCVTVGWMRFFPTQPDGDPSVQLPPTVTITDTDTDTQTTTNDTSSSTEEGIDIPGAGPPPHFHYKGIVYSEMGKQVIVNSLPEGFSYIGEAITYGGCLSVDGHCFDDLYGSVFGTLYMNEDESVAYLKCYSDADGRWVYVRFVVNAEFFGGSD